MLLFHSIINAVGLLLYFYASYYEVDPVTWSSLYIFGSFLQGIASAGIGTTLYSLAQEIFGNKTFRAVARMTFWYYIGGITGTLLSTFLVSHLDYSLMIISCTAFFCVPQIIITIFFFNDSSQI